MKVQEFCVWVVAFEILRILDDKKRVLNYENIKVCVWNVCLEKCCENQLQLTSSTLLPTSSWMDFFHPQWMKFIHN
jgi:hypothetical protein